MSAPERERNIASYIFSGSTTMIGVCVTVIALFKAFKTDLGGYADELLALNTLVFILSTVLSYISLKKDKHTRTGWLADVLFFIGMLLMVVAGIIIVYTEY